MKIKCFNCGHDLYEVNKMGRILYKHTKRSHIHIPAECTANNFGCGCVNPIPEKGQMKL